MKIALDYDGTYTADPELWSLFIKQAQNKGHEVCVVTMRRPEEPVEIKENLICIYTSRLAKKIFCDKKGLKFDIWIDDHPEWLFVNG